MNRRRLLIKYLFDYGLVVKAAEGAIEIVGGLLILSAARMFVVKIASIVTAGELASDPDDPVATWIRTTAHSFAIHTHYLLAAYLLIRGVLKVVLSAGMFRKVYWAFPAFVLCFTLFGAYEAYRAVVRSEVLLAAFALFDFMMVMLAVRTEQWTHHSSSG